MIAVAPPHTPFIAPPPTHTHTNHTHTHYNHTLTHYNHTYTHTHLVHAHIAVTLILLLQAPRRVWLRVTASKCVRGLWYCGYLGHRWMA
mgnify:CR=1 FL=1